MYIHVCLYNSVFLGFYFGPFSYACFACSACFLLHYYSLDACLFSRNRMGMDSDGRRGKRISEDSAEQKPQSK